MAEAWTRQVCPDRAEGDRIEAWSAGTKKHGMNPDAVLVMEEAGVDMSGQSSKTIDELPDIRFDWIVTLCGHANENCPYFPGAARKIHVGFDDPPALAKEAATRKETLDHYRRVRDEIRDFIQELSEYLEKDTSD